MATFYVIKWRANKLLANKIFVESSEQILLAKFLILPARPISFINWATGVDLQGGPKSKVLPNDQKFVLNRIKACQLE